MRKRRWIESLGTTALLVALAACGQQPEKTSGDADAPAAQPTAGASGAAKPASFAICAVCHSVEPDRNGVGPTLFGVVGRPAGGVAGYNYTPKMKSSGIVWTDATLDEFLAAPQTVVPGTKMAFAGVKDAAKRKEIVGYLNSLK